MGSPGSLPLLPEGPAECPYTHALTLGEALGSEVDQPRPGCSELTDAHTRRVNPEKRGFCTNHCETEQAVQAPEKTAEAPH